MRIMKIIKRINGCEIEKKTNENTGVVTYTVWHENGFIVTHSLKQAIELTYAIA